MANINEAKELSLLTYIDQNADVTQRELSEYMGVSLGAINILLKDLVKKGFIKISRLQSNSVKYFLTAEGIADKLERTHSYIVRTYREIIELQSKVASTITMLAKRYNTDIITFYGPQDDFARLIKELALNTTKIEVLHSVEQVKGYQKKAPIVIWKEESRVTLATCNVESINIMEMVNI